MESSNLQDLVTIRSCQTLDRMKLMTFPGGTQRHVYTAVDLSAKIPELAHIVLT